MGQIFWNFQLEKALREVLELAKGKGSWEDWERRWPDEVKKKAKREMQVFQWLGLLEQVKR